MNHPSRLYTNGEQLQQEIMDTLLSENMPLSEVHPFTLFLVVSNAELAQLCLAEIKRGAPFCHTELHDLDDTLVCFAHCHSSANSEQLGSIANLLIDLQHSHDCMVDGWEIKQQHQDSRDIATEVLYSVRKHFASKAELIQVDINEYTPTVSRDYAIISQTIEQAGFVYVTDTKDKQRCERHPNMQTCIRVFAHSDIDAFLTFYQIPDYSSAIMEISTFFSNGHAVITSTSPILAHLATFPGVSEQRFNINSDIKSLIAAHKKASLAYQQSMPTLTPKRCNTLQDINALLQDLQQSKGEYLESIGWVRREYVMDLVGEDVALGTNIMLSIQAMLEMERLAAA